MRRAALAVLGTLVGLFLLLGYKTHPIASSASPPAAVSTPSASSGSSSSGSTSSTTKSSGTTTVTGDAADTRYGPVQVRITVSGGKVTAATAVEYPMNDPRDAQINSYAIPVLQQETVAASSAQLDMVSGATYTSEGYLQSLQSALDKAGL